MLHWYLWLKTGTSRSEVWHRSCPTVLPRSQVRSKGYLWRERLYENGKIKDWVYYIYDEPCACDTADDTDVENSDFYDSQDTDFSDTETNNPTAFCKAQNNTMVLEMQFT